MAQGETYFGCSTCGLVYDGEEPKANDVVIWLRNGCPDDPNSEAMSGAKELRDRVKGTVWEDEG